MRIFYLGKQVEIHTFTVSACMLVKLINQKLREKPGGSRRLPETLFDGGICQSGKGLPREDKG